MPRPAPAAGRSGMKNGKSIPTATYRLQFHRDFTFDNAADILPYLKALGISHIYASSYLKARPGSVHGYDITGHNALNPEIGSSEDFERLCRSLSDNGLGQILDFVPNHMGVGYADNELWLDVLEWGRASRFAGFFDIDWSPPQPNLRGKLLLPLLGAHYGNVLERGGLVVRFDAEAGSFSVWYFDHKLPVHPSCYRLIRERPIEVGEGSLELLRDEAVALAASMADAAEDEEARSAASELKRFLARSAQENEGWSAWLGAAAEGFGGRLGEPRSFEPLHDLLERQVYRLAYWRVAAEEVNYRRFFDINELAGICMERPEVFAWTHRLVGRLIAEGKVQGLRLDHIDGLSDPVQYLNRLQSLYLSNGQADQAVLYPPRTERTAEPAFYVLVEKILASHEALRADWPVAGGTGYDCLNLVNGLFVDPAGETAMTRAYRSFLDQLPAFEKVLYDAKIQIVETAFESEFNRLNTALDVISERHWSTRDFTPGRLRAALKEAAACFPVYRTYITEAGIAPEDLYAIDRAIGRAKRTYGGPDPEILDFIRAAITTELSDRDPAYGREDVLRFAMRFQQYTGPVMAKALEDTSFYRYNRLLSLNEVGGNPSRFGVPPPDFHRAMEARAEEQPHGLMPLATHDTKRGADLRARLNVLSEIPAEWGRYLRRWSSLNRRKRRRLNGITAPTPNDEYMIYQTLIGAWPPSLVGSEPPDESSLAGFRPRLSETVLKAIREAKQQTSWYNPQEDYETTVTSFVDRILKARTANSFLKSFIPFQARIARLGILNSLCQSAVALTMPGVPDIYQGCELWDFNMVDPDNRRPVDFAMRRDLLEIVQGASEKSGSERAASLREWLEDWPDGRIKLALISYLLAFRQEEGTLFREGSYEPLQFEGPAQAHLFGFMRRREDRACLVVMGRLFARLIGDSPAIYPGGGLWADCALPLPQPRSRFRDVLTGRFVDGSSGRLAVDAILADLPVAVLQAEATTGG
jgi:(1->4)-alpha-D-glucan 1-alpha-D-glucosylmutase